MERMHAILAASAIDMICKAPVKPTRINPKAKPVKFWQKAAKRAIEIKETYCKTDIFLKFLMA